MLFFSEIVDIHSPLKAATKLVPVPESLMSPDYRPPNCLGTRIATPHQLTNNNMFQQNSIRQPTPVPKKELTGSPRLARGLRPRSTVEVKSNTPSPLRARKNLMQNAAPILRTTETILNNTKNSTSSEDELEMCAAKLQTIRNIAQERSTKKIVDDGVNERVKNENAAAVLIQKMWRGYQTRNLNKKTLEILRTIQSQRTEEHIQ